MRYRSAVYLIGVFILAFLVITALKTRRQDVEETRIRVPPGQRARIAQFWEAYSRASAWRRSGALDSAVVAYRNALEINDRHEDALYYLGNALFALGRYDEALDTFRRLIDINPLSARAHFQTGAILSCAEPGAPFDLDAAEREFRRTFEINREESEPLVRLGEIALAKGEHDRAEAHFAAATRLNIKAVVAHYLSGYIRWRRGDGPGARVLFRAALTHSQSEQPVHGVPGEGDTREGSRPGAARQSLFAAHVTAAMEGPPHRTDAQIDTAYRRLDAFCRMVEVRWQNRHNPH